MRLRGAEPSVGTDRHRRASGVEAAEYVDDSREDRHRPGRWAEPRQGAGRRADDDALARDRVDERLIRVRAVLGQERAMLDAVDTEPIASAIDSRLCAWATTGRPRRWASSTTARSSSSENCGLEGSEPSVVWPPDAITLITSTPCSAQTTVEGLGTRDVAILSMREREIAALVAKGLTNLQIAGAAHISNRTAENHVQHILTKLGLQNRSQIAVWVTQLGHPLDVWRLPP
jgi:DNA-binding CsgD family transcriptional regulator